MSTDTAGVTAQGWGGIPPQFLFKGQGDQAHGLKPVAALMFLILEP